MIITTARKPSSRTRTFCRYLARFTGCEYVPRGKTSISALKDVPFLLCVGEHGGNPASFNFFLDGRCVLFIRAIVSFKKEIVPSQEPVIQGSTPLALALSKATGFRIGDTSERVIKVNDDIEFIHRDIPYITLKVLLKRGEGIV